MEQLFLQAVAAEVQRTGVEETSFNKVYEQLRTLCTFDGRLITGYDKSTKIYVLHLYVYLCINMCSIEISKTYLVM